MFYGILFLLALTSVERANAQTGKSVKTETGTIVGKPDTVTIRGDTVQVDAFLGIPYAEAPTGDLRFRKPVPARKFDTPYEAFQYGASCPQSTQAPFTIPDVMSEDCLFLNVFMPNRPSKEPSGWAVMVWIHGGGLSMGNSDVFGGTSFVASGDVILVTFNYRLGMLGFFSTGNGHAAGNMGFWDQRLALQWVQANIEAFGGDGSRVTIFGESSGGISVCMQTMYPKNEGLFHRAIAQSGAPTTMAISGPEEAKESALSLGKLLNCTTESSEKLVLCLQGVDYRLFLTVIASLYLQPETMAKVKLYTTVDGDFMRIHPKHLTGEANKGSNDEVEFYRRIDFLSGFNNRENAMMATFLSKNGDAEMYEPSRDEMMNDLLPVLGTSGRIYPSVINNMIKSEYTNWNNPDDPFNVRVELIKAGSDVFFDIPSIEFARLHANSTSDSSSYLYYFTVQPTFSMLPMPSWIQGANHGDEIQYVFGFDKELMKLMNRTVTRKDWEDNLSARMIAYWTNFAKTGNPNTPTPVDVEWPKFKMDTQKHMEFRQDADVIGQYLHAQRVDFWLNTVPAVNEAIEHAHDASSPFVKQSQETVDKADYDKAIIISVLVTAAVFVVIIIIIVIIMKRGACGK